MRKKVYKEGDWFAVPVDSGYVISRIARVGRRGGVLLGYFFEPVCAALPTQEDLFGLTPAMAFDIQKFGDLGIVQDGWPIVYRPTEWNRAEWPMPAFGRIDMLRPGRGMLLRYDEDELTRCTGEKKITDEQAIQFPEIGLAGHLALQQRLNQYFHDGIRVRYPTRPGQVCTWFHGLPDPESTELQ